VTVEARLLDVHGRGSEVLARSDREAKYDIERDRRLAPEKETAILNVFEGDKRVFFILALETAMRMRECYTLGYLAGECREAGDPP